MVAKKNIQAKWWKDNNSPQGKDKYIINNPGQYVFPGGTVEGSSIEEKASKEFEEETGFILNHRNRTIEYPKNYLSKKDPLAKEVSFYPYSGDGFDILYAKTTPEALGEITDRFNKSIKLEDDTSHEMRKHSYKYRKDDELASLETMHEGNAIGIFGQQGQKRWSEFVTPEHYNQIPKVKKLYAFSTDWFATATKNINAAEDAGGR